MSGAAAPLAAIPLRDGRELRVGLDGIRAGEQFFELQRVQDARQVSPNPETIALRIQGAGLIEFQPARAGDGAVVLEALFRLRPELRPAGFGLEQPAATMPPPPALPAFPPPPMMPSPGGMGPGYSMPFYPPPPNYPPAGFPPQGYPPAPGYPMPQGMPAGVAVGPPDAPLPVPPEVVAAYGPTPNAGRGELTPAPRRVGEAISATFQLLGKHLGAWLALAALVALLPQMLLAALSSGLTLLGGRDPFAPTTNVFDAFQKAFSKQQQTAPPPTTDVGRVLLVSVLGFVISLVALLVTSWALAALSLASRDAVLGRAIALRASLRGGLARLFPVLGYELLVGIIVAVPITVGALIGGIAFGVAGVLAYSNASSHAPAAASILVPAIIGGIFILLAFVVTLYLGVRLALAPYLAALSMPSPLSASWSLVRGNWWRSFAVLLLPTLLRSILTLGVLVGAGLVLLPAVVTQVVVSPLIELLTLPLLTLAHVVLLYDLRLRREGYFVFLHERIAPPAPTFATASAPPTAPSAQPPVPPLG